VQVVALFTITAAPFCAGVAAGRYAGWFGSALPVVAVGLTLVLGMRWDWSNEAIFLVPLVALWSVAGFYAGLKLSASKRGPATQNTPS
jgi:hypothetical protein